MAGNANGIAERGGKVGEGRGKLMVDFGKVGGGNNGGLGEAADAFNAADASWEAGGENGGLGEAADAFSAADASWEAGGENGGLGEAADASNAADVPWEANGPGKAGSVLARERERLIALSDPGYRDFSQRLLPDGHRELLGVRLPLLRKEAGRLVKDASLGYVREALRPGAPLYFEEAMLAGMAIGLLRPEEGLAKEEIFSLIARFVPLISDWSVCDSFCAGLKIARLLPDRMWGFLLPYFSGEGEYEVRFAVVMALDYFLDEGRLDGVLALLDGVRHPGHYARMAVAWCVCECYVKFPERTFSYLRDECGLDGLTYRLAIQKITESRRVGKREKEEIRALRGMRGNSHAPQAGRHHEGKPAVRPAPTALPQS